MKRMTRRFEHHLWKLLTTLAAVPVLAICSMTGASAVPCSEKPALSSSGQAEPGERTASESSVSSGDEEVGGRKVHSAEVEADDEQTCETGEQFDQAKFLRERWGVELVAIRLTAHDHMVDFRYRVHDVEKAAPLFKRQTKPRLTHSATGKVLDVPVPAKTGALRTSDPPQEGRIYWMFFGNAGNLIKRGDRVTVTIGDFKAANLLVE